MRAATIIFMTLGLLSAGCSKGGEEAKDEEEGSPQTSAQEAPAELAAKKTEPLARALAAATDFNQRLRGMLQATMESQGPEAAIEVCAVAAPTIADEVMKAHELKLGRVAAPGKNRNPDQEAQGWTWEALREMIEEVERGARVTEQMKVYREDLPEGIELRMVRGIPTEALCTRCHGEEIEPSIEAKLKERYPGDGATGFREGTLRGALWVEVTTM